jgi:DNA-binding protein YbaB
MLEDLLRAAFNDGLRAQQALANERLGPLAGGMSLPGMH